MKTMLAILGGAFGGVAIAWAAMYFFRPTTSIDDAWGVLEMAFVLGGAGAGIAYRRRAASPKEISSSPTDEDNANRRDNELLLVKLKFHFFILSKIDYRFKDTKIALLVTA